MIFAQNEFIKLEFIVELAIFTVQKVYFINIILYITLYNLNQKML